MTNQTTPTTPATKAQLDQLIELLNEYGYNEEAGLIKLASDSIDEKVRANDETCSCFEAMGDNADCPVHGGAFENHGAFSDDEIKADYRERADLYAMGMGY